MQKLYIEPTKYTPKINLDPAGRIEIYGKSYPENTFEFYAPIISWLKEYAKKPAEKTDVDIEMVYFNSSTSKILFQIFDILYEMKDKSDVSIKWIYDKDNDTAQEAGEDFIEDFPDMDFRLIEKE